VRGLYYLGRYDGLGGEKGGGTTHWEVVIEVRLHLFINNYFYVGDV